MSWAAVRTVSPVDHHDLMPCVVHISGGIVVAAMVGVGAVVARWDVVAAVVTVVVTVVVVRADGGCGGRHGLLCWCCIYVDCFVVVLVCQIGFWTDLMRVVDSGTGRTNLRPPEDLVAFLSFLSATSPPIAADA